LWSTELISIKLWFENVPNPELEGKLPDVGRFTRLFCSIKFKIPSGWYDTQNAIVDTGAPISVIPLDIWIEIDTEIVTEYEIKGINPRKECSLPALIGRVTCILLDETEQSQEFTILAYLALTNLVPTIVGFKDLLEEFKVHLDYKGNNAWLENE
jgi:hypothetical protein